MDQSRQEPKIVSVPSTPTSEASSRELFLIDGNSLAYRAFFALPETIATSAGMPTNAIFGFASMLVKILTEFGAHPTLVAWDAGMSGREVEYPDYKAERRKRPDLLSEQWPHLAPLAEAFGYRNVRSEGYEADDVIATLARQARALGIEVTVVTGDRDALQLVEPGVRVMATSRGITDTKIYDRDAVIERYGVPPERFPDLIGLKGDTSDNIPGVPGIGEKTAAQLLQRFGDLETVLESVDEISGAKRKQNLVEHAENARMSKRIAVANRALELDIDVAGATAQEPDRSRLREVFREFELRDPLRRIEEAFGEHGASAGEPAPPVTAAAAIVRAVAAEVDPADLASLEGELATLVVAPGAHGDGADGNGADNAGPSDEAADSVESGGPRRFAAYAGGERVLVGRAETLAELTAAWGERPVVAHDWKSIATAEARASAPPLEHDTMIAAYLIDPARRRYALAELAEEEGLGAEVATTSGADGGAGSADAAAGSAEVGASSSDMGGAGTLAESAAEAERAAAAADPARALAAEALLTRALAERQREVLAERGLERLLREVELPLVEVLVELERAGVKLDGEQLAQIDARFSSRIDDLEREIHELAGGEFTIGSPAQLAEVLFEKLGLSRKRRGKTGFSTDARVLQAIRDEHPIVAKVERWRELTKLKSTYLDALPELVDAGTGRLHTTFNQAATTTGRLSSTDPNLQNVPIRTEEGREIRSCFVADEGAVLLSADYSQVELRVLAHIAGEDVLKEIFRRGEDVHAATSAEIFDVPLDHVDPGLRSKAKMVNFGIVYGLSAFGLADRLQIPQEEAAEFIERYLDRFPRVRDFIRDTISGAAHDGYVTTLLGRVRSIPELHARQRQTRQLGERLAVNTVIQGTAADIIKLAMVRCHRALAERGLVTRLVLQIHDELLFEGPAEEADAASALVRREMIGAFELDPPLAVEVGTGPNWLEAK